MTDQPNWKALCRELVYDLEDWHIAFGHEAAVDAANQTFERIERVKAALQTDEKLVVRSFSELTKDLDTERRDRINARKQQLTEWSLENFINKYKDPVAAKQFLVNAGIIDDDGQLAKPYRQEQ